MTVAFACILLLSGPAVGMPSVDRRAPVDCAGCDREAKIVEKWAFRYFPDTYAGVYVVEGRNDRLRVGFTSQQSAHVRAVKHLRGLSHPGRIVSFPITPKHSLRELDELESQIVDEFMQSATHAGLITSVGIDVEANLVAVGAEPGKVHRAKGLLRRLYGDDAPIRVESEEAPSELLG